MNITLHKILHASSSKGADFLLRTSVTSMRQIFNSKLLEEVPVAWVMKLEASVGTLFVSTFAEARRGVDIDFVAFLSLTSSPDAFRIATAITMTLECIGISFLDCSRRLSCLTKLQVKFHLLEFKFLQLVGLSKIDGS